MPRNAATLGSALFFLLGPGLEAGAGPWLVTGGWDAGPPFPAHGALLVLGVVLVAVGAAVVVQAFAVFVTHGRGTPAPVLPARRLVVRGSYRFVRNPIYLATAVAIAGQALVLSRPVLLAAATAYLLTLAVVTRRWEEPVLLARFGTAYDAYRRAVPGWWPRATPWPGPNAVPGPGSAGSRPAADG